MSITDHDSDVPIHVLVVDDDPLSRTVLKDKLEEAGMRVTVADDAQSAIQAIATARADVMILDFLLPEGTGLDVWDHARAHNTGLAHRTIMLTGVVAGKDREELIERTDLPVLEKPAEDDVLIHMIQRLVED